MIMATTQRIIVQNKKIQHVTTAITQRELDSLTALMIARSRLMSRAYHDDDDEPA